MTISPTKAKRLAKSLMKENRTRSWRQIAKEDYSDQINYATLNRFAIHKGTWLPRDEKILVTLGLKKPCVPKSPPEPLPQWLKQVKKKIAGMAKDTRRDVLRQL